MTNPTHSDFSRFETKVETAADRQFARVEGKVDELGKAVVRLVVTEERQLQLSRRVDEHVLQTDRMREQLERRQAALAERFDKRVSALEHLVQRYLGISSAITVAVAAAWAVASKFIH